MATPSQAVAPPIAPPAEPVEVPWGAIARVGLAVLSVLTAFGSLLPIFPLWVKDLAGSDTAVGFATTVATGLGLVGGRPIAARLMEGRQRRPTLRLGALLCGATCVLFLWASNLGLVLALRFLLGVGFALVTTAGVAAITDLAPPARRGQILGLYGAGNALSLLVGPMVGAVLRKAGGFDAVFLGAAVLTLGAQLATMGMREPTPAERPPLGGLFSVFKIKAMRAIVPAHGVAVMLHGAVITLLPLRLAERADGPSPELFFALDAAAVVGLRVLVGRRFDTLGRLPFVLAGLVMLSMGGVLLGLFRDTGMVAVAAVLYGFGFGAYVPAMNALVGDLVPASHRVRGFALFFLAFDLSLACGGVVVGPVADTWGRGVALGVAAITPLLALAIVWGARRELGSSTPAPALPS